MKSAPITQKAGSKYGSSDNPAKAVGKYATLSPVKKNGSDDYNPALAMGAGQASKVTIPSYRKETRKSPGETYGRISTDPNGKKMAPDKWLDFCAKNPCHAACHKQFGQCPEKEEEITVQEDKEIEILGEDWQGNLEREIMGDVRKSPHARKDRRGLTQFRHQAASDARKDWKFADEAGRKTLLEEVGLKEGASRRDYVKAKKAAAQRKITKGHEALLDTQLTGAERGDAPGSKTFKGTENLPFAALSLSDQRAQLRAQAEANARARIAKQTSENNNNSNNGGSDSQSTVNDANAQYNNNMAQFYAEAENAVKPKTGSVNMNVLKSRSGNLNINNSVSPQTTNPVVANFNQRLNDLHNSAVSGNEGDLYNNPRGPQKIKSVAYKMNGFGSKTYKK